MKKVISVLLALTLCLVCGLSAMAAESPTADQYYTIDPDCKIYGVGTAVATPSVGTAGEIIVLTATAGEGYVFDHWELDGIFGIVEGDIYDPVIKIEIVPGQENQTHGSIEGSADIRGEVHFRPIDPEATTAEQQTAKPDSGSTAPQTGTLSTQAVAVILMSVAGLMAVAYVYKKRTVKTK